jgi:hypothetical protein
MLRSALFDPPDVSLRSKFPGVMRQKCIECLDQLRNRAKRTRNFLQLGLPLLILRNFLRDVIVHHFQLSLRQEAREPGIDGEVQRLAYPQPLGLGAW